MRSNVIFGGVCGVCVCVGWLLSLVYRELLSIYEQSGSLTDLEYSWFFRLLLNMVGYASVLVPVFILYKYLQRINYFDKISNQSRVSRVLFSCFGPYERLDGGGGGGGGAGRGGGAGPSPSREGADLAFCFIGLMAAYLVWGLLQEKIMTQKYILEDGSVGRFTESTLLVLVNRLGALLAAAAAELVRGGGAPPAPLVLFAYCALSNVLSAWCQYEALKYVSFPTQVLSKSCKVIPVMLMGILISRNKYSPLEYVTAALISIGMVMFLFGAKDPTPGVPGGASSGGGGGGGGGAVSWGGALLLGVYLWSDSFTSSWQAALFQRFAVRPTQMLAAVNLWSCLLTAAALPRDILSNPVLWNGAFVCDCVVLSLSSALGQLLIYRTIARFGAVVFAIIMTLRQAVSILLSCVVYGHAVSWWGGVGVGLVFAAVLLRLYAAHRRRPALAVGRG